MHWHWLQDAEVYPIYDIWMAGNRNIWHEHWKKYLPVSLHWQNGTMPWHIWQEIRRRKRRRMQGSD